jgi:WhiB family transcriptional regulator, redox-sensing transcriptional regulator
MTTDSHNTREGSIDSTDGQATARDHRFWAAIVARLSRLRSAPSGVLAELVAWDGACMEVSADDRPPRWLHEDGSDPELAARLCRGCPVQRECLELELRMFGEHTVGVWGALDEDSRRALYPYWRRARQPDLDPPDIGDGGAQ